jgi:hypothetical protein
LVLALAPAAQAAVMTWESPVVITTVGDSVISNEGTLITAIDFQDRYTYDHHYTKVINGVDFTYSKSTDTNPGFGDFIRDPKGIGDIVDSNGNMNDDFVRLLKGHAYSLNADKTFDGQLRGLIEGESYLVQFLVYLSDGDPNVTQVFTSGGASTGSLNPLDGYSLVGRFVADEVRATKGGTTCGRQRDGTKA